MDMLDPRGVAGRRRAGGAPASLRGLRIGVLDNSKPGTHSAVVPTFGATRSVTVAI
jgi:hypothetical protein